MRLQWHICTFTRTLHALDNTYNTINTHTQHATNTAHALTSGEDAGARVEGGLDAGLGDGDGLLLHGLVDRHLVVRVHLQQ